MLTLEKLREYGANVDDGMKRCFGNEEFYLKLVNTVPDEKNFDVLADAAGKKDLGAAFEAAHALKGVLGNLEITPIGELVNEITELLRSRTDMDYTPMIDEILSKREELRKLCE